ncbi:hypothetical protein [Chromobacterium haemolyticum]|uniref:hypothetical protein n=1 Tax=Chromobacterium haemolyticum TaxID=394935 RepID=UPI00138E2C2D|nr:hypothetical protein [Chromobacterium haemolyticum]
MPDAFNAAASARANVVLPQDSGPTMAIFNGRVAPLNIPLLSKYGKAVNYTPLAALSTAGQLFSTSRGDSPVRQLWTRKLSPCREMDLSVLIKKQANHEITHIQREKPCGTIVDKTAKSLFRQAHFRPLIF